MNNGKKKVVEKPELPKNMFWASDGIIIVKKQNGTKPDGSPNIKARRAKTLAEAKKKLAEINQEFKEEEKQKFIANDFANYTFEEYGKYFLKKKKPALVAKSYRRLESTFYTHLVPAFGMVSLSELNDFHLQDLLDQLFEKKMSYSSIKKVFDFAQATMDMAKLKKHIGENPFLGVEMFSPKNFKKSDIYCFDSMETRAFVAEAERIRKTGNPAYRYGSAFVFLLNTGMRESEICGLKKDDLQEKGIFIRRAASTEPNPEYDPESIASKKYITIVVDYNKTFHGTRIVPYNRKAKECAETLRKQFSSSDMVICTNRNGVVPPASINREFKQIIKNAGLPDCAPHTLRHTFASHLFANGYSIKEVSELLGHSSTQVTEKIYLHILQQIKLEKADSLRDLDSNNLIRADRDYSSITIMDM